MSLVKEILHNNNYMDKFYNKKTNRYNSVQAAIKNGLFREPHNFDLPKNTVFVKAKKGYEIVPKKSNLKIKTEELFYADINRFYVYDPITQRVLNKTKKSLNKVAEKEVLLYRSNEEKYIKNITKRLNNKGIYNSKIIKNPYLNLLYDELKKYTGKKVSVGFIRDNRIIEYHDYFDMEKLTVIDYPKFWKNIIYSKFHWMIYSGHSIFDEPLDSEDKYMELIEMGRKAYFDAWNRGERGALFIIEQNEIKISKTNYKQFFRDGLTNCLLTPIKTWVVDKIASSESKTTKSKYRKKLKTVDEMINKFSDGVPEGEINNICNELQIDINIDLPFNTTKFINCLSSKKSLNTFNFINTKLNHVDNSIVNYNNKIKCTTQELENIKTKLDKTGEFYTYNRNFCGIISINTLDKSYSLENDYFQSIMEFEKDNDMNEYKIDDIDDKELSEFVKLGVHYNGTIDFKNVYETEEIYDAINDCETVISELKLNSADYLHIDIEKAYAFTSRCYLYEGFLGKITDFRKTDKIEGLGMYQIYDLDFTRCDEKFKFYNDKMSIYREGYIYPSPELKLLDKYNVSYKIKGGCWGVDPVHLIFGPNMFKKMDDVKNKKGKSYYGVYCGSCNSIATHTNYKIKGNREYAELLKQFANNNTSIVYNNNNEISVSYPKNHVYHLSHITAFCTSYTRITVLNQLMGMDLNKIVRVCSDGIYTSEFNCDVQPQFKVKKDGTFGNHPCLTYINSVERYDKEFNDCREHYEKELHLGGGGCGKTHFNLVDKGLIKALYVSPSWKLAVNKKEEYNYNVSVWARVISRDSEKIKNIKKIANVLIIDEISMMTECQKKFILNTYSNMKIIFCGDLGYQIEPINDEEMTADGFDYIKEYTINKRFKCEKLGELCEKLRQMIKERIDKYVINKFVTDYFKDIGKVVSSDLINYNIEDMILTGTNIHKDYFTDIYTNKFDKEKYYITENSELYQNGCIVIGDKPHTQCKIQHAFTVHSIQGETAKKQLFIDNSKMFCSRMFYTAISRAEYLEQITIIIPSENMTKICKKKLLS